MVGNSWIFAVQYKQNDWKYSFICSADYHSVIFPGVVTPGYLIVAPGQGTLQPITQLIN